MKILLTGCEGQVGWELARSLMPLGDVIAVNRRRCDLLQPERIPELIRGVMPDVIVNAAAYTAVDQAEREESTATIVNAGAVGVLAQEARRAGALLVHYSTDYVFDGTKSTAYTEQDAPCPINAYGRSKLKGEEAIRGAGCDYLVFRTSWLFASRGRNFVKTILKLAQERETLRVVDDQIGAPTWARNVADATAHAIREVRRERITETFSSGIFHLTARGTTSWHGFACAVVQQLRALRPSTSLKVRDILPIASAEYPTPARRPKNSLLDGTLFKGRFGIALPNWDTALKLCLAELIGTPPTESGDRTELDDFVTLPRLGGKS